MNGRAGVVVAGVVLAGVLALPAPSYAAPVGAADEPVFAGYASSTFASPVRVEIYEPTIPIPASPQAELNFGYTTVKADSSTARGRASFFWPGDAVGEGFKTILEQLQLPPELVDPIAGDGYPVQVNSAYPGGPETASDEQVPGSIQRTSAGEETTKATNGFSTDCQLGQPTGDASGSPIPIPGLPDVPGVTGVPGLGGLLESLNSALAPQSDGKTGNTGNTGKAGKTGAAADAADDAAEDAAEEPACPIPAELAALVDIGGYGAQSQVRHALDKQGVDQVRAVSTSTVGEVSLLGGLITMSGITSQAVTSSDGEVGKKSGITDYGVLTIAGQKFRYGDDGFEAAGTAAPLPGLPADPNQVLSALGIQLLLPQPTLSREGDKATSYVEGIQVVIDATVLRQQLSFIPFGQLQDAISSLPFPDQAAQVKSLLGAALNLSPKIVITLGNAYATVDTSPPIELPDTDVTVPDNDPGDTSTPATGGGSGGGGDLGAPTVDTPAATGDAAPALADGDLSDAAPMGAGLPPLFSIPGALLFGGIIGATILGSYLRRIGLLALGGGSACAHGLDSGLPDLRKA